MKPSFALDLRDERVTLLHRTSRGWQEVGSTRFDAPDLAEALAYMRSTALGLSPRGISTKVVIPNDQILYTAVTAPGPEAAKRKRQVKAALDGLTPYPMDEIVYDTQGSGPEVQVAVVAKTTLAEAEAFAAEHRFNPVSFVAVPAPGGFAGEPFFGPSAMSPSLLAEGEKVERDSQPIEIVARDLPKLEPRPEPKPEPAVEPAAEAEAPAVEASALTLQAELPLAEVAPAVPPVAPEPVEPERVADAAPEPAPPAPAPAPAPEATPATVAAEPPRRMPAPADEAPMAVDVPSDDQPAPAMTPAALKSSLAPVAPAAPTVTAAPAEDDLPPAPSAALRAVLAARRSEQAEAAPSLGAAGPRPVSTIKPVGAIEPPAARGKTGAAPAAAAAAARAKSAVSGKPAKAGAMVTAPGLPGDGRRKSTAQLTVVPSGPATEEAAKSAQPARAQTAGKPLTGLGGKPLPTRGRPRYLGLILTGILLVFLVLIAAWASYFTPGATSDASSPAPTALSQAADPGSAPAADAAATTPGSETVVAAAETPTAADAAAPDAAASAAADTPTAADEAAADGQDADVAAATETVAAAPGAADALAAAATESATGVTAADTAASVETTPDPAAAAVASAEAPAPAATAAEPAPGTAVSTEAATGENAGDTAGDEIFLAAAEPPTELPDPAALPVAGAAEDSLPQAAASPPPFGTVYRFDDQGRILPTPEGVVTPEGVTLVAGTPPQMPPARPAAIAALAPTPAVAPAETPATAPGGIPLAAVPDAAAAPAATDSNAPDATAPDSTAPLPFPSDPALQDFRPRARPANLVPTAAEPPSPAPADPRLAGFRPRARSATVAALAPAAVLASDPASTAGLDAAAQATVVSALAVDVSRLPPARPAALAQAVNAAVNQAVAEASPPAADSSASGGDSEPDPASAAPTIPSNASVSKTATEKDVLVMNKVALIGIFGSDSARYAYVRLSNGALKKVKVGDALDGGTVVAISATDLRYQKSGKVITLAMPRES